MNWTFNLPVRLEFGNGKRKALKSYIDAIGGTKGVLVCDGIFKDNGVADEFIAMSEGTLAAVFSDIRPNPTTDNVNACVAVMREIGADFAVALGGGSSMDCCKAASAIAKGEGTIEPYHLGEKAINAAEAIPMIALSTTSGTASEITNIAVLTNVHIGLKQPMNDFSMYAKIAIIDPELTLSVPPRVTASTGLDVLSHAVEGYWALGNQPVCSACALHAAKLVFEWLEKAYQEPSNLEAREKMSEASIVAGVAFSHPRTTGSHACSFPLTNIYHVPHGEACAFTLDYFMRFNADREGKNGRIDALAQYCGFADAYAMADEILALKKRMGMRTTLAEIGCTTDEQIQELTDISMAAALIKNNPYPLTAQDIHDMFVALK
ncbi:MAG: iron-containing alcohol dehydrogenase [Eubacterium sp.]|nr:iron-containing alcohol dehydrogenase [Eubacterium sp.]